MRLKTEWQLWHQYYRIKAQLGLGAEESVPRDDPIRMLVNSRRLTLEDLEMLYIEERLRQSPDDESFEEIAEELGISKRTLWTRRKDLGLTS